MQIPYPVIRSAEDRTWTARLLERLAQPDLPQDERDEVVKTIERLADPRADAPLLGILEDRSLPDVAREAAGVVLRSRGSPPCGDRLRKYWAEGDRLLRRHALLEMGHAEADIVESVARDPAHPLHVEGIVAMEWGFQEPRFQDLKIAALGHVDPGVREAAARTLFWDEPVAAEVPLLRAALDPLPKVAVAAIKTLAYYPSRRCLRALAALEEHRDAAVRDAAKNSVFEIMEGAFRRAIDQAAPAERRFLFEWLTPVRDRMNLSEDEIFSENEPAPPAPSHSPGVAPDEPEDLAACELIALFADPDGPWAEKKKRFPRRHKATLYAPDRGLLISFFVAHRDPWIRDKAAEILAAWDEHDALLGLTRDPAFPVRKTAMYWLSRTSPKEALAAPVWEHLHGAGTTSTHAYETLTTYRRHAATKESVPRLLKLVRDDARESVRVHAVYELVELRAAREVEELLPLLAGPPYVTWALHIAILSACRKLDLRYGELDTLRDVDNIDVQIALAPLC